MRTTFALRALVFDWKLDDGRGERKVDAASRLGGSTYRWKSESRVRKTAQSSSFFRVGVRPMLLRLSEEMARWRDGNLAGGDDRMSPGSLSVDKDFRDTSTRLSACGSPSESASPVPPLKMVLNGRPAFLPRRLCRMDTLLGLAAGTGGGSSGTRRGEGGGDKLRCGNNDSPSCGADLSVPWLRPLELVRRDRDDEDEDEDDFDCSRCRNAVEPGAEPRMDVA